VLASPARRHRHARLSLLAAALAALLLCSLLCTRSLHVAAGAPAVTPRRALRWIARYAVFPYHKVFDCFTIGLTPLLFPLELLQCVAWST
jgi:hypothetical protein